MNDTDRTLAPYEARLLDELRGVVSERAAPAPVLTGTRAVRPRKRITVGLAVAAALAVAAGVGAPALLGAGDRPAYAAEREPDGSIRIHIREYRDAAGLQARLRHLGVAAVVDYVPNGQQCREPRAGYVPDDQVPQDLLTSLPPQDGEAASWRLQPDLIKAGQTFVYTTTIIGDPDDDEWMAKAHVELATGPVGACELVPGPEYGRSGG